jgi:DNA-binding MarR family transcriptional regulator
MCNFTLTRDKRCRYTYIVELELDRKKMERCAECACFNLRKASRVITQLFDRSMQAGGLRGTQFSILIVLSATGPIPVTKLSEHLVMDRTTLTRNLRPLEKQGLISLMCGKDLRIRTAVVTPKGLKTLKDNFPLWERVQNQIIRKLGRKRFDSLIRELSEIASLFTEKKMGV